MERQHGEIKDDARLTLLERKVDAIIEYLLNKEETNTKLTKELYV